MTRWVVERLGPDVPMHFTAFHPDWKMLDRPPTPAETLRRSRRIAIDNGVRYVHEERDRSGRADHAVRGVWRRPDRASGLRDHGLAPRCRRTLRFLRPGVCRDVRGRTRYLGRAQDACSPGGVRSVTVGAMRMPAAAGTFYPRIGSRRSHRGSAAGCDASVVRSDAMGHRRAPRWISVLGPVAASAYAAVLTAREVLDRIVIIGPDHFVPLVGCAVPPRTWRTPLGEAAIDAEMREVAIRAGCTVDDEPHAHEHALGCSCRSCSGRWGAIPVPAGRGRTGPVRRCGDGALEPRRTPTSWW